MRGRRGARVSGARTVHAAQAGVQCARPAAVDNCRPWSQHAAKATRREATPSGSKRAASRASSLNCAAFMCWIDAPTCRAQYPRDAGQATYEPGALLARRLWPARLVPQLNRHASTARAAQLPPPPSTANLAPYADGQLAVRLEHLVRRAAGSRVHSQHAASRACLPHPDTCAVGGPCACACMLTAHQLHPICCLLTRFRWSSDAASKGAAGARRRAAMRPWRAASLQCLHEWAQVPGLSLLDSCQIGLYSRHAASARRGAARSHGCAPRQWRRAPPRPAARGASKPMAGGVW